MISYSVTFVGIDSKINDFESASSCDVYQGALEREKVISPKWTHTQTHIK